MTNHDGPLLPPVAAAAERASVGWSPVGEPRVGNLDAVVARNGDFHTGDVVRNRNSLRTMLVDGGGTWTVTYYELINCPHTVPSPISPRERTTVNVALLRRELRYVAHWREGDPCEVCGEDETPEDPLAHYLAPSTNQRKAPGYVMAHGRCGLDYGLVLA
jgi:hypothetical protein